MSKLNPYDIFLDERPVDAILSSTADAIADCLNAMGPNRTSLPPAPGKWSAAEIVCAPRRLRIGLRIPAAPDSRRRWPHHPALRSGQMGCEILRHSCGRSARRIHCVAQLESAHDPRRTPGRGRPNHDAPRARHHDLSDHRRNHGRPRSESPRSVAPHRGPDFLTCVEFFVA